MRLKMDFESELIEFILTEQLKKFDIEKLKNINNYIDDLFIKNHIKLIKNNSDYLDVLNFIISCKLKKLDEKLLLNIYEYIKKGKI